MVVAGRFCVQRGGNEALMFMHIPCSRLFPALETSEYYRRLPGKGGTKARSAQGAEAGQVYGEEEEEEEEEGAPGKR